MKFFLFVALGCIFLGMYLMGHAMGRRNTLTRSERRELHRLRVERHNLYMLSARHVTTEPFAVIVMDELNKKESNSQ